MFQKVKNIYHLFQAAIANIWYGFPSRRLKVIGVTGTDGKTTTTHLIAHILKENGKKVSFISSVYASIANKEYDIGFHVTTPSSFAIQKYIKRAADAGDEYFVLETTSHALDQNRVWGIHYIIGVVTNVTHEHLDYHGTYENYVRTKARLLRASALGIINSKDKSFDYFSTMAGLKYKTYDDNLKKLNNIEGATEFNLYNFAAAYTVCLALGLRSEKILGAILSFKLPKGRLEIVYDKEFKVIIDFAHTPNAFSKLLPEIKETYQLKGRLIHVFGAAALRDVSKRPLMGQAAGRYDDIVVLTEEDYRTEDPLKICDDLAVGLAKEGFSKVNYDELANTKGKEYAVIVNREKAVREAIKFARKGDIVVLTGKSHEKSLCRGKTEYPYSEHEAVKKATKNKYLYI